MEEYVLDFYISLLRGIYPGDSIEETAVKVETVVDDKFTREDVMNYWRAEAARQYEADSLRCHQQVIFENL
jgi:predicted nucleotide-binding protein (sugar kinase/HSP70/actin superfamily)